jgi:Lrp/AsnC family transcriptional regulator, leucine-responsive regulatory protein
MTLDRIDKKILKALQVDGRIPNAELAEKIGISKTACWNHTKRLMDEGYIRDIKASLNAEKLGLSVVVIVGVVLDRSTPDSFAEFEKAIKKIPAILECWLIAGEFDYWLKIRVKDIHAFNRLHANALLPIPGVRQLRSFFVLNGVKDEQELQIE